MLNSAASVFQIPFHFAVRGFLTLVDLADALLIGLIAKRVACRSGRAAFIRYLLNPVAILIVGFHGQFDNLALLPLLLAVYLGSRRSGKTSLIWIWLLGTAALIIKHITFFMVVWLFLYTVKKKWLAAIMLAGSVLAFLAVFIPYLPEGGRGILTTLQYQGTGIHGPWRLVTYLWSLFSADSGPILQRVIVLVFAGTMVVLSLIAKDHLKLSLAKGMELSSVAFLALSPAFSIQYLLIPVVWGSIITSRTFWVYTLIATLFTTLRYFNLVTSIPVIRIMSALIWLATSGWLISYFYRPVRQAEGKTE